MCAYPVFLDDIHYAATALDDLVVRAPVLENEDVDAVLGERSLPRAENFQRTGAFKIRGAYNRVLNLTYEERARGTVNYSSGNHALGSVRADQMLGSSAVIVMLTDVPAAKIAAARALGDTK
jgi:threonine dehydratase